MYTTIDKALAAIIGGFASFLLLKFGVHTDWLTPDLINTISLAIAGGLTYLVPNKPSPS